MNKQEFIQNFRNFLDTLQDKICEDSKWKIKGFTLGSHGEYFKNRESNKNIQFPYNQYQGHFCLGVIYDRIMIDELTRYGIDDLKKNSVCDTKSHFIFCREI